MDNPVTPPSSGLLNRQAYLIGGGLLLLLLLAAGLYYLLTPRVPPPCDASTLQVGSTRLRIQTLAYKPGDELTVPSGKPNIAFWVQGTNAHFVFGLSPTAQNLDLDSRVAVGDPILINWADCSSDAYVVSLLEKTIPEDVALLDQSKGGITVFAPKGSTSAGWLIEGQRPQAPAPQTPEPTDANAVQAEISFLDQSTSADGKTLNLKIDIKNTGSKSIHLTSGDISLATADGAPAPAAAVQPDLPLDIQPGASQTIAISFLKPAANTAVFKILDFSVDLYF